MFDKNMPLFDQQKTQLIAFGVFIFCIVVACFYGYRFILPVALGHGGGAHDFIVFYTASSMIMNGEALSVYDHHVFSAKQNEILENTTGLPWLYPPTYFFMTAPLALIDIVSSRLLFFGMGFILFVYASRKWIRWPFGWFMVAGFGPVLMNFCIGQNGLYTAAFILLALYNLKSRAWLAGFFISLLLIKPQLGVLIPFALLAGREYKAFSWATFFTGIFLLLSVFFFGFASWKEFVFSGEVIINQIENNNFPFDLMASMLASAIQLGFGFKQAMLMHVIYAVPFLVVTFVVWRRTDDMLLRGASLGLATVVCSPYILEYDLAWLALPIGMLGLHARKHGWLPGESLVLTLAWLLPLLDFIGTLLRSGEWFPYNFWPLINLALLLVIIRRVKPVIRASASNYENVCTDMRETS